MSSILSSLIVLALILSPFVLAPLMWRRMKRVRAMVHAEARSAPRQEPWQEPLQTDGGLTLARSSDPNEELIALGARARQTRWPIDNA